MKGELAPDLEDRVPREILETLIQEGTEAFRKVLEKLLNLAMGLARSEFLGAEPFERSSQRLRHARLQGKIATQNSDSAIPHRGGYGIYPTIASRWPALGLRRFKSWPCWRPVCHGRFNPQLRSPLCGPRSRQPGLTDSLLDVELVKFRIRPLDGQHPYALHASLRESPCRWTSFRNPGQS